ncbi:MAG: Sir2 family NAD-dependent protein deacetylase [Thiotrichales bacterium]|nr:Sir2 family NAD-dependent protein deacetylase [Thiotrichales bacterium]MCY4285092.1 Sir2 family NAD-dependent protein deacetylase [Thiotrichales bacterium]
MTSPVVGDPDVERLRALVENARRAVVFTGAGISTESGIPDFRSPGGMWSRRRPVDFRDFVASESARREAWSQRVESHRTMGRAEPNHGHRAVASLVHRGIVTTVITQNIDGLHQRSGVPDARVVELHGNSTYARCIECGAPYTLDPILEAFTLDGTLPVCDRCGGHVKTATISFGQAMPEAAMRRAEAATAECDLFLAIGSSLVVYPAAGFPAYARRLGATLVILNRDPTELDALADLVLHREIGPTLGAVTGIN